MKMLKPDTFFDLSLFSHAELFADREYVWEALTQLEEYLKKIPLGVIKASIPSSCFLVNPESISIGKGTIVEPGAFIQGPCVIGENCSIRHGAYLRGQVVVGDRCVIGHATEVKHSILLNDVHAAHFNYVGDSILGNGVHLGGGFICSNLRFDENEVTLSVKGERVQCGMKKLGLIAGDGGHFGCNGVSNPGTVIGRGSFSYPGIFFGGYYDNNSKIKRTK